MLGVGVAAPLALQLRNTLPGAKPARGRTILSSLLTLAGGLCLRYVMVMAGRASADDPRATFAFARSREKSA